ncbi:MAG: TetR/AcrR family transcriptional regulator [Balneolaceae bacterium]
MTEENQNELSAEERIFEAAKDVFHQKGFEGARMQEIADKAGINKSMLHYYYRSKDKLFEKIYKLTLMRVLPQIISMLNEDLPLEEKLHRFTSEYLKVIRANPEIPSFIIHELNTNPSRIQEFFLSQVSKKVQPFINQVRKASEEGSISPNQKPEHVIINTMSLILFPFIGKPILQILFGMDEQAFTQFIDERVEYLPDYIVQTTFK